MKLTKRAKRAARELLDLKQWPVREAPAVTTCEQQIYAAIVRDGDVCFDIGANKGDMSLFLARLCGEDGQVVSFEPVWATYVRMCRAVQIDTNVKAAITTVPMGMADVEKDATIQMPQGDPEQASMADPDAWSGIQGKPLETHHVHFTTLDAFLTSTGVPSPTLVKIDVEGAELFVLRGAAKTFDRGVRPMMVIEVFAPWEHAFGYTPWAPLSWLVDRGYRFLYSCPEGLVSHTPTDARPMPAEYVAGYNVIAYDPLVHADRVNALKELCVGGSATILPMTPVPRPNIVA